jgi:hypothetical protein
MALLCQECQQGLSSLSSQFDDQFAEPVFQCFRKKVIRYLQIKSVVLLFLRNGNLKVLTNDKRGGLNFGIIRLVSLYDLQAEIFKRICAYPIRERPKTGQGTLFLSFQINNCFQ